MKRRLFSEIKIKEYNDEIEERNKTLKSMINLWIQV